jgi:alkylation response protein AidB-like acyl-CoA dehydrogenase
VVASRAFAGRWRAKSRQFGKRIADFQLIQKLARMATDLTAARLYSARRGKDQGAPRVTLRRR